MRLITRTVLGILATVFVSTTADSQTTTFRVATAGSSPSYVSSITDPSLSENVFFRTTTTATEQAWVMLLPHVYVDAGVGATQRQIYNAATFVQANPWLGRLNLNGTAVTAIAELLMDSTSKTSIAAITSGNGGPIRVRPTYVKSMLMLATGYSSGGTGGDPNLVRKVAQLTAIGSPATCAWATSYPTWDIATAAPYNIGELWASTKMPVTPITNAVVTASLAKVALASQYNERFGASVTYDSDEVTQWYESAVALGLRLDVQAVTIWSDAAAISGDPAQASGIVDVAANKPKVRITEPVTVTVRPPATSTDDGLMVRLPTPPEQWWLPTYSIGGVPGQLMRFRVDGGAFNVDTASFVTASGTWVDGTVVGVMDSHVDVVVPSTAVTGIVALGHSAVGPGTSPYMIAPWSECAVAIPGYPIPFALFTAMQEPVQLVFP